MKIDDKKLKKILQDDTVKMDDDQKNRLDLFLDNLPEKEVRIESEPLFRKSTGKATAWKVAFAMLATLVILTNVNPSIAYAMYEIPVLGKIFEVVTVRNYEYVDETHEAEIKTPEIIVKEVESEGVDKLNEESRSFVDQIIEEFESGLTEGAYQAIYVDYEVVCDKEEWFTLKLTVSEIAASSDQYYKYYHIDKSTGELVSLGDLFENDGYIESISENIRQQMVKEMEACKDGSIDYWVEKADEDLEPCYLIHEDQNFYYNKAGEMVIAYDKYTVGSGAMGCPEFVVAEEVYREYLK